MSPLNEALDRRRRRDESAFDRLLVSARELFAEKGFAHTSLDAIAEHAGVTKGSLYHHFHGKRELFEAVFENEAESVTAVAAAALNAHDQPWVAIEAALSAFFERSADAGTQRILFQDAPSMLGWARVREIDRRYGLRLVETAVVRVADAGEIRVGDPATLSHLLFAALIEACMLAHA